jgi:hypothetical protein
MQAPFMHACPAPHRLPQVPQFVALEVTSTHCPPQACWPTAGHAQLPPEHARPAGQALLHAPQCPTALDVSTQLAPHCVSVMSQRSLHVPCEQTRPGPQALPQVPQFCASYEVSVHAAPHALCPEGHEHAPFWQT